MKNEDVPPLTEITIKERAMTKPGSRYSDIWWSLMIHVGGERVVWETCWDYDEARTKADAWMAEKGLTHLAVPV